jgi:hypothetical protein
MKKLLVLGLLLTGCGEEVRYVVIQPEEHTVIVPSTNPTPIVVECKEDEDDKKDKEPKKHKEPKSKEDKS